MQAVNDQDDGWDIPIGSDYGVEWIKKEIDREVIERILEIAKAKNDESV